MIGDAGDRSRIWTPDVRVIDHVYAHVHGVAANTRVVPWTTRMRNSPGPQTQRVRSLKSASETVSLGANASPKPNGGGP